MKFLNCTRCHSIVQLPADCSLMKCRCGKSKARYVNDIVAEVGGDDARILGVSNSDYGATIGKSPYLGADGLCAIRFEMFVIPESVRCHVRRMK